jgi:hypothetical protein
MRVYRGQCVGSSRAGIDGHHSDLLERGHGTEMRLTVQVYKSRERRIPVASHSPQVYKSRERRIPVASHSPNLGFLTV